MKNVTDNSPAICKKVGTGLILMLAASSWALAAPVTLLVSGKTGTNIPGNGHSYGTGMAPHGYYIGFCSTSSDLVPGDTNGFADIFLRTPSNKKTERISVSSTGAQGNGNSGSEFTRVAVSNGARFVAFTSDASNLVPNDTNNANDIFVRDRINKKTIRVSVSSAGDQAEAPIGFEPDTIYGLNFQPGISADGHYVFFASFADNLVPGDTNNATDIFAHDMTTGVTERVSIGNAGQQSSIRSYGYDLSVSGRYVGFFAHATDFGDFPKQTLDYYVRDMRTGQTISLADSYPYSLSSNESYSVSGFSDNLRYVNIRHITAGPRGIIDFDSYVYDRTNNRTFGGNDHSYAFGIKQLLSANGRFVAYSGIGLSPFGDVYVNSLFNYTKQLVSINNFGVQLANSALEAISYNGQIIAFTTDTAAQKDDTNNASDIYIRRRW